VKRGALRGAECNKKRRSRLCVSARRLLAPLQHWTAWLLDIERHPLIDVERHPLTAVGIVAGALLMIGGGGWSLVRTPV
jgi:hypothetical protein